MVRDGLPIGRIAVSRSSGPFSDRHIDLVSTFADQAVIAIENVRLFTERSAATGGDETLEQQTATADIFRVIWGTPRDVQPVFDTIAPMLSQAVLGATLERGRCGSTAS